MIRTGQVAVSLKGSSWLLGFETSWMPSNVCLWNTIAIKLQVCSSRSKKKMELSSSIQFIFRELQTRNGRVRLSKGTSFTEKRWCHFNLSDHKWEDLFSRQSSKSKMILHVGFFSFLWHTCVACQCIQETLVSSAFHELPPDFFFFIIFAINNEVTLPLCRHEKNLDTYTFVRETERKERSQENKAHSCM